ncbi:alpha-galactosidase [Marisediminicola senii]|uniref:alpha-galactosidase n=1 Tax=Marisediminicola senii TaxID=2711233 RepID=UPI001F3BF214|nr:alpha-galactosidase [Marisediminicola senii]
MTQPADPLVEGEAESIPDRATQSIAEQAAQSIPDRHVQLRAAGVSLIVHIPEVGLPAFMHWGSDPGPLDRQQLEQLALAEGAPPAANGVDEPRAVSIMPEPWTGWTGAPGLDGHRAWRGWSPRFTVTSATSVNPVPGDGARGGTLELEARDDVAELQLDLHIELTPTGLVVMQAHVTNLGADPYTLGSVSLGLPVPTRADELLDLAGRWAKERVPQRRPFAVGTHLREGRRGRTGSDAATVLVAGEQSFGFDRGEAWGMHVAFSGNHQVRAERVASGERILLGGELLLPGEVELARGERYSTPRVFGTHGVGLDALAGRFHDHLRSRPHHPGRDRPVVMNVWEAVYFTHDLDRITALADAAAQVGVERFVLDDGWFGGRRDDTAGLGDWTISDVVWGDGRFRRLVDHVAALGMEFGLWFEPEMVNEDSDLARAHPEWLMQVDGRLPVESRFQQVLDLSHPGAFEHVRSQIVALVRDYDIGFIKWDHNRDLVDAGSTRTGRAGVHEQTLAVYRLLDEIKRQCPGLEIESCSSGGSRVDLEILERTDRVWASDTIDAHERQQIQRWTAQLLPPELVGSHVGSQRSHTTGRMLDLSFRAATALFGHFGIEWDLTAATDAERAELAAWVRYYKQLRGLLHTGTVVRRDLEGGDLWLNGVISTDRAEALYLVTVRERHITWPVGRVLLPGLDPDRSYRVTAGGPSAFRAASNHWADPAWWRDGVTLPGSVLVGVGIAIPAQDPDHAALIHVAALR